MYVICHTMYVMQCIHTPCNVRHTLCPYAIQCTPYTVSIRHTMYAVQCMLYSLRYMPCNVRYIVYAIQCTPYMFPLYISTRICITKHLLINICSIYYETLYNRHTTYNLYTCKTHATHTNNTRHLYQ